MLKKYEIAAIAAASAAVIFTGGFFAGRANNDKNIHIEPSVQSAYAAGPAESALPAEYSSAAGTVNINTAGLDELESLPGIGAVLAGKIIAYRTENGPFGKPEDILNVDGIGDAKYSEIRELITVR